MDSNMRKLDVTKIQLNFHFIQNAKVRHWI